MSSYIKNAGWIFTERLLRIGVGFILFALTSRVLGPADFGILTYYQTLAVMLLCITNLGFDNVLINEFSKGNNQNKIFVTAFWSRLLVSLLVICVSILSVSFHDIPLANKYIFILCLSSLLFQTQNTYFSFFQAKLLAAFVTKVSLLALVISSFFKMYLLYIKADIYWFAFSYSLDFGMSFSFILIISKNKKLVSLHLKYFSLRTLRILLLKSWPLIASSVIIVLYTRLDQIMIMKMMGAEAVAIFSVAVRISEAYLFVPMALVTAYYPLISHSAERKNIRFYFDIVLFSSSVMALFILFTSYYFIPAFFGSTYVESFNVLSITIIGSIFSAFGAACTNLMIIYGLTYIRLLRAIFGLLINFTLNIILIPKYGIMGAAYASLFSQLFATWLSNALNKKTFECFKWQSASVLCLGIPGGFALIKQLLPRRK